MRPTTFLAAWSIPLATVLPASGPPPGSHLIVPGKGVGKMSLGPDGNATLARFGKPATIDAGMMQTRQVWVGSGGDRPTLYIHTVENGVVDAKPDRGTTIDEIRTSSRHFRTASGIGVGSTLARVREAFPGARRRAEATGALFLADGRKGIGFEFPSKATSARCVGVSVWVPRRGDIVTSAEVSRLLEQARRDARMPRGGEQRASVRP